MCAPYMVCTVNKLLCTLQNGTLKADQIYFLVRFFRTIYTYCNKVQGNSRCVVFLSHCGPSPSWFMDNMMCATGQCVGWGSWVMSAFAWTKRRITAWCYSKLPTVCDSCMRVHVRPVLNWGENVYKKKRKLTAIIMTLQWMLFLSEVNFVPVKAPWKQHCICKQKVRREMSQSITSRSMSHFLTDM